MKRVVGLWGSQELHRNPKTNFVSLKKQRITSLIKAINYISKVVQTLPTYFITANCPLQGKLNSFCLPKSCELSHVHFLFQLFKGIFYYCDGPDAKLVQNKTQCLELSANGNRWVNHKYNFDNLGQALMSLFVLSSKDGWVNIMYQGLDAVGVDQQVSFLLLHSQYGKTTISLFLQKSPFSPRSFQRKKL